MLGNNAKQTRTNEKGDPTRGRVKAAPPQRSNRHHRPRGGGWTTTLLCLSPFSGADAFSSLLLVGAAFPSSSVAVVPFAPLGWCCFLLCLPPPPWKSAAFFPLQKWLNFLCFQKHKIFKKGNPTRGEGKAAGGADQEAPP